MNTLKLIINSFKYPALRLDSLCFSRKRLWQIASMAVLIMSLSTAWSVHTISRPVFKDIADSQSYIPDFDVKDNQLTLKADKALYYSTDNFQLIIDDQIISKNNQLELPKDKADMMNNHSLISLIIGKNRGTIKIGNNYFNEENSILPSSYSKGNLVASIQNLSQQQWKIFLLYLLSSLFLTLPTYCLMQLTIAFFAGTINPFLKAPLPFSGRLRLAIFTSIVPLFCAELINVIFLRPLSMYLLVIIITVYLINQSYIDHTRNIRHNLQLLYEMESRIKSQGIPEVWDSDVSDLSDLDDFRESKEKDKKKKSDKDTEEESS